jgi:hypothetical protein
MGQEQPPSDESFFHTGFRLFLQRVLDWAMDADEASPKGAWVHTVKEAAKREWTTKELRSLNLKFVRNLAFFVGAIYVFRKYGKWMEI